MPLWKSFCFLFISVLISAQGDRSDWVATNPVIECPATEAQAMILCPTIYQPVCAYRNSDPPGTSGITIANFCVACFNAGYDFYSPGACEEINNGEGPTILIPSESETGESGESGEGEFGSEEEVSLTENEEVFRCEATALQLACDSIYDPVCAYHDGDDKGTTVANSCEACSGGQGFDYYTEGACSRGNEEEDIPIDIEGIPAASSSGDL